MGIQDDDACCSGESRDQVAAKSDIDGSHVEDALEEVSVTLELQKTGERGSGYRTLNDPDAPFQREVVVERRGILEVRCRSQEVVHGFFSPDTDKYASLLVYDINLDTTKRSRRILSATVKFEFGSWEPGVPKPIVHSIAPLGRVTLLETSQEEALSRSGTLSASAEMVGSIGASITKEKTVFRTISDSARVSGNIFSDSYGKGVGASWVLQENESIKSGVPTLLRCAILLTRGHDSLFQCKVSIEAKADWKTEIGKLAASTPRTDPILFDPSLPPTNKLRQTGYNTDRLASVSLDELIDIRFDMPFQRPWVVQ